MELKPLILIVEDDKSICKFIKVSLETQGYKCKETQYGNTAISMALSMAPDIIILDLGLPDMDGIEIIEKLKGISNTKIIVVSARGHEREKVEALDAGADDYLTKPFGVSELLARIRVCLRNIVKESNFKLEEGSIFQVRDFKIDYEKRKVYINNEEIHLTPIEYKLVVLMSKYAGKVLTHKFIINEIWGSYMENETQSLRVFMASIRRKIEKDPTQPEYIITEMGVGYRMIDE
ncbi:response regulator transcription factor [Paraclostridium ghonii]|uniref:Stage 0 sporulation protein A homolog n=1 Tax=Paraclostridium ghonii TaxID=29358 RepID=A0ABU0MY84_9FIRM|nr:response regulator [Paeniclostridium ghonii]MDQ0555870.1 two-component system KDP operon response regulator KdpE [Paeniclostridium ghonii]